MASTPFFGKRESPVLPTRPSPHASLTGDAPAAAPAAARASDSPPVAPPVEGAPLSPVAEASAAVPGGSKLIVGPNIKLKGVEITDCDTLVVEGLVEATMDSRLMQIAEIGAFKGSAQIDIAEIRGSFDGDLTVRDRLVIYGTGKVTGTIRYGKVVIEEGGQLAGDISVGTSERARAASPLPALQRAA
jgi:cytoskeletal protein CcmA (bactofilin family)